MSLKLECQTNWIFTQIRVSLKYECQSNWKTKQIENVVNPKTSKSASIGRISILFFGQSGEASWWRVCYQRGLPRLVSKDTISSGDEGERRDFCGCLCCAMRRPQLYTFLIKYACSFTCIMNYLLGAPGFWFQLLDQSS